MGNVTHNLGFLAMARIGARDAQYYPHAAPHGETRCHGKENYTSAACRDPLFASCVRRKGFAPSFVISPLPPSSSPPPGRASAAQSTISSHHIMEDAISSYHIMDGAIQSDHLADKSITADKIGSNVRIMGETEE